MSVAPMRICFCLPGLHRTVRGAEVAFESIASGLTRLGRHEITMFGSGEPQAGTPYEFVHVPSIRRERFEKWPRIPALRSETQYEELSFIPGFLSQFRPSRFDLVVTCSYPYLNWAIRSAITVGAGGRDRRPRHVFVTQNGDWPLHRSNSEFLLFGCDAAVCTNPDYYDTHAGLWRAQLIPNGVDCRVFSPGPPVRSEFGLPEGVPVILMVSALITSKRVLEGIQAVSALPDAHLVVAGDGPLRTEAEELAARLLPGRFRRVSVRREQMPDLYRSVDAFLHMSIDEPSANAYMEALATGLPIVAHDRRVTRWCFGDKAILVDALDLAAVSAGLRTALSSPKPREDVAGEARRRFDWSSIAVQYAEFFKEIVA